MLNILALRYGTSSMVLTLESFIMMVLRMVRMNGESIQTSCDCSEEKKKIMETVVLFARSK